MRIGGLENAEPDGMSKCFKELVVQPVGGVHSNMKVVAFCGAVTHRPKTLRMLRAKPKLPSEIIRSSLQIDPAGLGICG
jgi:hypothetical protein